VKYHILNWLIKRANIFVVTERLLSLFSRSVLVILENANSSQVFKILPSNGKKNALLDFELSIFIKMASFIYYLMILYPIDDLIFSVKKND
jgi:hypothetical protein